LDLPDTSTSEGIDKAIGAILKAVSEGKLLPGEGTVLSRILETRRKALETYELEQRIVALEKKK